MSTGISAPRVRATRAFDVKDILQAVDFVVIGQSTLGLEAMIIGKPVVVLLPEGTEEGAVPYVQERSVFHATSSSRLIEAWYQYRDGSPPWKNIMTDSRRFMERYACSADGRSAERISQAIEEIVNTSMSDRMRID